MTTAPNPQRGHEWGKWGPVFVILCALSLLVGAYLLDLAAPQKANLLDKRWNVVVRSSWDQDTAHVGALLVAASAAASVIGLAVRTLIGHGHRDRAARALGVIGAIAALGALWVWLNVPLG